MGMCWKKKTWSDEEIMEHVVEGARTRGTLKRTWRELVQKDCQAHKLNRVDAMDHSRIEEADTG